MTCGSMWWSGIVLDEQLEDKEMGKLMTMSENIYSMTSVDLIDVNKGDQPFLYM